MHNFNIGDRVVVYALTRKTGTVTTKTTLVHENQENQVAVKLDNAFGNVAVYHVNQLRRLKKKPKEFWIIATYKTDGCLLINRAYHCEGGVSPIIDDEIHVGNYEPPAKLVKTITTMRIKFGREKT